MKLSCSPGRHDLYAMRLQKIRDQGLQFFVIVDDKDGRDRLVVAADGLAAGSR
jgi:hypothetical protein